jgi:hypothetical protein
VVRQEDVRGSTDNIFRSLRPSDHQAVEELSLLTRKPDTEDEDTGRTITHPDQLRHLNLEQETGESPGAC